MLDVRPVLAGSSGSSQPFLLLQKASPTPGTAILLIHGFGGGSFAWRHVMQPLATRTGLRVLAFDRPAFGEPTAGVPHLLQGVQRPCCVCMRPACVLHDCQLIAALHWDCY